MGAGNPAPINETFYMEKDMPTPQELQKAREEGAIDRLHGEHIESHEYEPGSKLAIAYEQGWSDQDHEMMLLDACDWDD